MATEGCQLDEDKVIQLQIISTDDEDVKQLQLFDNILTKVKDFGKINVTELRFILMKKQNMWKIKTKTGPHRHF